MEEIVIRPPLRPLPIPWPPEEPDPVPDDIHQPINWLTYSHRELYAMVNEGLDLERVTDVAAQWARLGNELDDISGELRRALAAAVDSWQGTAAAQAQERISRLAAWAEETADGSNAVSECVSEQAALASAAQRNMPDVPIQAFPDVQLLGDFAGGPAIITNPQPERNHIQQQHRQAAEVMEQYQQASVLLYHRVPTFVSPSDAPDDDSSSPGVEEDGPKEDTSASTFLGPSGTGGGAAGLPGGAPASGSVSPPPTGEQHSAGFRAGTAGMSGSTGVSTSAGAAGTAGAGRGGMGPMGMPMGAGSRSDNEDAEHRTPGYLEEEEDIWGVSVPVVPPVLGEDPPGGGGR